MVMIAPRGAKGSEREDQAIKGPGIRLDLDVRRVWRCPSCQRVLKTAGHITSRRCPIDDALMQLDDSAQRAARRFSFPPIKIEEEQDDAVVVEQPPAELVTDDNDRPRKQSRKQKRRRRRRPGGSASQQETATETDAETDAATETAADSQADTRPRDDSPVTGTVEGTGSRSATGPDADAKPDPGDRTSQAADQ